MAGKTKSNTATAPATTTTAPSQEPVSQPQEKKQRASKKSSSEQAQQPSQSQPEVKQQSKASTPAVVAASAPEVAVASADEPQSASQYNEQLGALKVKLLQVTKLVAEIKSDIHSLEKTHSRELRASQKSSMKRRKKSGNRAPSGITMPVRISDELSSFLGKPKGHEMARTQATSEINAYIKEHKLQDPKNGRQIIPDSKLRNLLKLEEGTVLSYFNLQKYMKNHFPVTAKSVKA